MFTWTCTMAGRYTWASQRGSTHDTKLTLFWADKSVTSMGRKLGWGGHVISSMDYHPLKLKNSCAWAPLSDSVHPWQHYQLSVSWLKQSSVWKNHHSVCQWLINYWLFIPKVNNKQLEILKYTLYNYDAYILWSIIIKLWHVNCLSYSVGHEHIETITIT